MEIRLKGEKTIQHLFREGKQEFAFPCKIVYLISEAGDGQVPFQFGVSVSKRLLRRAVDRNLMKRRLREAVRHIRHRHPVIEGQQIKCMIIYCTSRMLELSVLEKSMHRIFSKIIR